MTEAPPTPAPISKMEMKTLRRPQRNKFEHIARKLMLEPGNTLVDVGCGWGGMLFHAALRHGVKGVGNTLSQNQFAFTCRRIEELGLRGQVEVKLLDYRELTGKFDKFVSVGMFEHVGKRYISVFMKKVADLLKKGGIGLLHTIAKDVQSDTDAWTLRYIFPGGYIPSLPEIVREMGLAGLCILDIENLRLHYGRTLDCWVANFERNIDKVRSMYDEGFIRMWRLYLNASAACFKYDGNRLYQILFSKGLNNKLPTTRRYVYNFDKAGC